MLQKQGLLVPTSRSIVKELTQQLRAHLFRFRATPARGFHRLAYLASIQFSRPVIGEERSGKSRPSVYKLSMESFALICAGCSHKNSFKQTRKFNDHSPEASRAGFGLEASASKRRDRSYQPGRSKHWVKVENRQHPAIESNVMQLA